MSRAATITVRTRHFEGRSYRAIGVHVDGQPTGLGGKVVGSDGWSTEAPREAEAIECVLRRCLERGHRAEFGGELPEVPPRPRKSTTIPAAAVLAGGIRGRR